LLYAGGIAAIAANNYATLFGLLTKPSQYLEALLREPFRDLLPDDSSYQRTFDRFEYMLAMMYMDQSDDLHWAQLDALLGVTPSTRTRQRIS
jgi:hypothetical protein